ncbi:TolC family protein [Opitutus sp. ER46]|uniref:TolC family protein n=1 Tax=Opitutus sp. ER46 TaxID=2161864 RepID=UPI000D303F75|nr:TolC family protein [Opitutus sp. ER46]PTX92614.1 hypothetical protein DB354_14915 [Opitutus sp. ER46]
MLLSGLSCLRVGRAISWLALTVVTVGLHGQSATMVVTLPEDYLPGLKVLLAAAVKQSPDQLRREALVDRADAEIRLADRQRWPNLGGDFRYNSSQTGISGNADSSSDNSGLFYNIGLDQAVFHWGDVRRAGQIARIRAAVAAKEYADAYRELAVAIRQSYLSLVASQARLREIRYTLTLRQQELASAKEKQALGVLSGADIAGRELELNEAQLEVDRVTANFTTDCRRLARLAGVSDLSPESIPDALPLPRYDPALATAWTAAVLRDGGRHSFRAQVLEMRIREADLNYRTARMRLLPKFNFGISHSVETSTTASESAVSQTAITRDSMELRGNWTIFDGFATRAIKAMTKADRRYAEAELRRVTEEVMDQAQQYQRNVVLDARAVELTEQRRHAAELGMRREQELLRTQAGEASQARLERSQRDLRRAEAVATAARAAFLASWSAFVSRVTDDPALQNLPSRYVR